MPFVPCPADVELLELVLHSAILPFPSPTLLRYISQTIFSSFSLFLMIERQVPISYAGILSLREHRPSMAPLLGEPFVEEASYCSISRVRCSCRFVEVAGPRDISSLECLALSSSDEDLKMVREAD